MNEIRYSRPDNAFDEEKSKEVYQDVKLSPLRNEAAESRAVNSLLGEVPSAEVEALREFLKMIEAADRLATDDDFTSDVMLALKIFREKRARHFA